jgi:gas vesicle protein
MENGNSKIKEFGIGLGIGLVIGGMIALLTAPQEGKKTRELIKTKAEEAKKKVKVAVATIKDKLPKPKNEVDKVHIQ